MLILWFKFFVAATLIVIAARILSINADKLAEIKNWGRAWVGLVLLATITSLPELTTTCSAVIFLKGDGASQMAVANVLGSNVFNLFILFFLDVFLGKEIIWVLLKEKHDLSLGAGIIFTALVMLNIWFFWYGALYRVGYVCWFIFIAYWPLMWYLGRNKAEQSELSKEVNTPLAPVVIKIFATAVIVVAAAVWLVKLSDNLAELTGWGHSFVGGLFVALVTSLPELVVSWTSVKLKAVDMAMGNILGSNIFNLVILFVADLGFRKGAILGFVSLDLLVPAGFGLAMMLIAYTSIKNPHQPRYGGISLGSLFLLLGYLLANYWLFELSKVG